MGLRICIVLLIHLIQNSYTLQGQGQKLGQVEGPALYQLRQRFPPKIFQNHNLTVLLRYQAVSFNDAG